MDERDDEPWFRRAPGEGPRFVGPSWRSGYIDEMWEAHPGSPPDEEARMHPAMDDAWRQGEPPVPVDYRGVGPKGYRRSDARLLEEVCERLMDDPRVDASGFEVDVEDGVVTVRGSAPDRQTKRLAGRVAYSVSGVRDVMNEVRLAAGEPPRAGRREREERGPNAEHRGG